MDISHKASRPCWLLCQPGTIFWACRIRTDNIVDLGEGLSAAGGGGKNLSRVKNSVRTECNHWKLLPGRMKLLTAYQLADESLRNVAVDEAVAADH